MSSARKSLYVDSSVIVSWAVRDSIRESKIIEGVQKFDRLWSSDFSQVEAASGIAMEAQQRGFSSFEMEQNLNRLLQAIDLISVNDLVIGRARALVQQYRATHGLRSLDAIHVASAEVLKTVHSRAEEVEFLTTDRRQAQVFTMLGWVGTLLE
jgi:predicted nucleic acid-binding protein